MRSSRLSLLTLLVLLHAASPSSATGPNSKGIEFFEKKIRPVLVEHCYACHSQDADKNKKLRARLYVDSRAGLLRGGAGGPAVVPGKAKESPLYQALLHGDGSRMPPEQKLPDTVIADFAHWIDLGAPDPRDQAAPVKAYGLSIEEGRKFWSFQPLRAAPLPAVKDEAWPKSAIDSFVRAAHENKRLQPVGDAGPGTILRRLYFDLVGLPPAPEEVEAFDKDYAAARDQALEKVVDRLLASPHFGERWGRHWLDLARYAESNGRARNMVWHHAWRYRDWVIDALNRGLPYDQFVRQQIAGDLLPAASVQERDAQRVATGLLALGPKSLEEIKRDVFVMDLIDEQIDVIGKAFLGLSIACARCHDHKFDPIPTHDYYALAGILRSTETLYGQGPRGIRGVNDSVYQPLGNRARDFLAAAEEHLEKLKDMTQKRNTARSDRYRIVRRVADLQLQAARPRADAEKLKAEIERCDAEIKDWDTKIKRLDADVIALESNPPPQPDFAMAVRDATKPTDCRIHLRGEVTSLGETAPRGVLQVIRLPGQPPIAAHESGRRQLADWLAHPENPLVPRVAVNRVWQHLFGRGLVSTSDDFGVNGARPSHPELLDHLARQFIADGWSIKKLIRSIVLSRTYQLSSEPSLANHEIDPDNLHIWRQRPRRLQAEAFRDAVLAVSGQLERAPMPGSPVAKLHPFKDPEFGYSLTLKPEQQEHRHRSVYLPIVRGNLPELLRLFDFADPSMPAGQRDETVVPVQASFLMNSPWMIAQARHLAARLLADRTATDDQRVDRLYLLTLARLPKAAERDRIVQFLQQPAERLPIKGPAPTAQEVAIEKWTSVGQALLASAEFRYLF